MQNCSKGCARVLYTVYTFYTFHTSYTFCTFYTIVKFYTFLTKTHFFLGFCRFDLSLLSQRYNNQIFHIRLVKDCMNFDESHDAEVKVSSKLSNDADHSIILSGEGSNISIMYTKLDNFEFYQLSPNLPLSC